MALGCDYYDADGDKVQDKWISDGEGDDTRWIKQDVPYKDLLIRLSDGKIWCIDGVTDNLDLYKEYEYYDDDFKEIIEWDFDLFGEYKEDGCGSLYYRLENNVYKYNLDSSEASFEQVVALNFGYNNFDRTYYPWGIAKNGVVWNQTRSAGPGGYNRIEFAWPHSGFCKIDWNNIARYSGYNHTTSLSHIKENLKMESETGFRFVQVKERMFALIARELVFEFFYSESEEHYKDAIEWAYDNNLEMFRVMEFEIGDTPESLKPKAPCLTYGLADGIAYDRFEFSRMFIRNTLINSRSSFLAVDNSILVSNGNDKSKLSIIDLDNPEWRDLKELDFKLDLESADVMDGKIFVLNNDKSHLGVYWFDIKSFEDGFTKFNVTLPDYVSYSMMESSIKGGLVVYVGRNPGTGNYERIRVNILTGEASHETSEIDMFFQTIVSLN